MQHPDGGVSAAPHGLPIGPTFDPAAHLLEPELLPPIPRPIPAEVLGGPHVRRCRTRMVALAVSGVVAIGLSQLHAIERLALYLLPLRYCVWIGAALIVSSVVTWFDGRRGGLRYLREGVTLPARVTDLTLVPEAMMYGQPTQWRFHVIVELSDPISGQMVQTAVGSEPIQPDSKDKLTTSFAVGDYVTAVYLPPDMTTLRLYPLLGLKNGVGIIDRPEAGHSRRTNAIVTAVTVSLLIGVAFWNVVALHAYEPLAFSRSQGWTIGIGGLVLGGAMLFGIFWERRRGDRARIAYNVEARVKGLAVQVEPDYGGRVFGGRGWLLTALLLVGGPLLGGLTTLCWGWTLNALFDSSSAERRPVRIREALIETRSFILRTYRVDFEFDGDGERHSYQTTPEGLARLAGADAVAMVRAGRFGWEWVSGIEPTDSSP